MKNTGTTTWTTGPPPANGQPGGYMLVSANPLGADIWNTIPGISYYNNSVPISATGPSASVAPGQTATFTFIANAPSPDPGTFNFQWTMMHNFVRFFGDLTPNVVCTIKADNVAFVSQVAPPATMTAGQSYPVSVTMQNTGASTWQDGTCQLLSENPRGNQFLTPSNTQPVAGTVLPGGSTTVSFTVVAPTPGSYNFQWTMSRKNIHEFGQFSTNVPVTVVAPSVAVVDLAAVATGSNKITLYWAGYSGSIGYNIYLGLQSGGPYTKINSSGPVSTPDNSAGLTNVFMYTDSPLATGTTYYYYVAPVMQNGTEAGQSNEDSATPNASAVPWDTADPTQIINAVSATAALDLEPDYDDSGDTYPAQVGVLQVAGPDGAVYMGNFPDGSPAQAFTSHGYSDGNSINYDDGRVVAAPHYDAPGAGTANSSQSAGSAGQSPQVSPVPDHSPFPATDPPSGPYREVRAAPGYTGFSAAVGIPNASDTQTIRLVDHVSTSAAGVNDFNKHYTDAIDIYTGGYVYQGSNQVDTIALDAGLQLTLLKLQNGTYQTGYWATGINAARPAGLVKHNPNPLLPSVFLDGAPKALPVGKVEYKVRLAGEVRMQFLTPAAPHVADQSVELHFSLPVLGLGTGQMALATYNPSNLGQPISVNSSINSITLVYYHVPGWRKNSTFVLKRINSIAQSLRSPNPSLTEQNDFDLKHPGAPFANGPTPPAETVKGFLTDGCYVVSPVGSGSFAGAYWGNADSRGVEMRGTSGGWISWTDDPTITMKAGAYPNTYNSVANWLEQNAFF